MEIKSLQSFLDRKKSSVLTNGNSLDTFLQKKSPSIISATPIKTVAPKPTLSNRIISASESIKTQQKNSARSATNFLKTAGQGIARSFLAIGTELAQGLLKPEYREKPLTASYTPKTDFEKKIFGTDKPVSFRSVGEEVLAIGGEDFKNKWGKYSIPIGVVLSGLDVFPGSSGAKKVAKESIEAVAKKVIKDGGKDIISQPTLGKKALVQNGLEPGGTKKIIQKTAQEQQGLSKTESFAQAEKKTSLSSLPKTEKIRLETKAKPLKAYSSTLSDETAVKSIVKTVDDLGESPRLVARVLDSLRKARTNFIETVQNTDVRVKELIEKKGVKLTDESDPYLKMTLFPGRVGKKVEDLKERAREITMTIEKSARESGTDLKTLKKEVSDYLYFRHAPERNVALGERAAGITTKEAQIGLKEIEQSKTGKKAIEIANKLQKINDGTLDILKDGGVITNELYSSLRAKYKYHVPLNRIFEETEDIGQVLSGRGFDVRSTGIKAAKGSERAVDDIVVNILTNQEQAIIRAEKNIVDNATLKFVRENKDIVGNLMKEVHPRMVGKTFKGIPIMEKTQDPTILQLFENGKRVWIKFGDERLAIAFRGVGREKIPGLLKPVASFTRLYSGLATRFNPEFFLPNKIRDLQETMVYMSAQKGIGARGALKTVKGDPGSIKDVVDAFRGVDSEGARLYKEMRDLGGTTGGMGLSTRKQIELNMSELERLATSKTRQVGNKLVEYIDKWNTIFEDSTRLSVYKASLKQGLSKERAAFFAKEASINFNRMGKGGPIINSLWMFSNASLQGTAKMIGSLKNPKVLGGTVLVMGASVSAVNEWNDMADPKWRDKVSKWDRLNGLPIVLPSEDGEFRYFVIPVSWGLKPIKVMTDYAYDTISGEDVRLEEMTNDLFSSMIDAYNPAGGTDVVSALTPTILDVPVEIARNKSWSGHMIRPQSDPNAPSDVLYFQSLGETKIGQGAIAISKFFEENLGVGISPADIKYGFDQYISGAGRTVAKFTNLISSATNEEPLPLDEYPFISRFYRERTQEEVGAGSGGQTEEIKKILQGQSRERFNLKQEALRIDARLQKLSSAEANAELARIKQENPELADKIKDVVDERKLGLTYTEKLMKQLGVENGERAKYINDQILKLATPEERNAYYQELRQKKIITDEVASQIKRLLNK